MVVCQAFEHSRECCHVSFGGQAGSLADIVEDGQFEVEAGGQSVVLLVVCVDLRDSGSLFAV